MVDLSPETVLKKVTTRQVFSYEFCEIFKNAFFIEHLRASERIAADGKKDTLLSFTTFVYILCKPLEI